MEPFRQRPCRVCATPFNVARHWQLFCSKECRAKYHREMTGCFFCGEPATDRHHIIPASWRGTRRFEDDVETVLTCSPCNGFIGDRLLHDVVSQAEYLIGCYEKKYKLNQPMVEWDDEEFDELGRGLRARIIKLVRMRQVAMRRVEYLRFVLREFETDSKIS